jgi:hydroxymethylbilane synthase
MVGKTLPASLKLGTRKSLLAWAQSSWVARKIEQLNPGVHVELVGIETRGDRIVDVSLQSVEGKEFFVAELDTALQSRAVDFTVHSMKDLSLERPAEFVNACVPPRENPRDVILFGPGVMDKIGRGEKLKIGTSSPRRLENIPPFLVRALPTISGHSPQVDLVEIRGNVNTRLSRVHEPRESSKHLDAVVLAFAGLIRLWADEAGKRELKKLLEGVRWMVLPLKECPAAPAQGALAVECRAKDSAVRAVLAKLHDPVTWEAVSRERALLAEWGGGCHQKFGATSIAQEYLGSLLYIRGKKPDQSFVDDFKWNAPSHVAGPYWNGSDWRSEGEAEDLKFNLPSLHSAPVFVAHARAVSQAQILKQSRVWVSGTSTWFKLAREGIWVEGCGENLGFEFLAPTLGEGVLQLPSFNDWTILTHQDALDTWDTWSVGKVVSTYRLSGRYAAEARSALQAAQVVFWSSTSQWNELKSEVSPAVIQCCGAGKTAKFLKSRGVPIEVFPSVEEWKKWAKI